MKPYLAILSARFRTLLQYRAAAVAGFGCQLFWGLIRMMIFSGFYQNAAAGQPMSLRDVITYVWLGQAFMMLIPLRVDSELAHMITTGNVAYELLRPVDLYWFWYGRALANRIAPTVLRATPMLVVAASAGWIHFPSVGNIVAFVVALAAAVLLASSIGMLMSISMFWTVSGRGVNVMFRGTVFLLSGMIVPLPLFPDFLQPVLNVLPFCGLIDLPFRLFMENIQLGRLPAILAQQLAWTAGLIVLGRWLIFRATRKLVVQGG